MSSGFASVAVVALLAVARANDMPPTEERPLSLRAAIAEALNHGPDLRPAGDRLAVAQIQERLAASRFGLKVTPSFQNSAEAFGSQRSVGVGVSKRLPFGTQLSATVDSMQYGTGPLQIRDAGYGFTLSQPLLQTFGPALEAETVDARRGILSSERAVGAARQQIVLSVADAYFAVIRSQRLVDAGERTLERATKLHAASEARTKIGLATQLDVLRADLFASQAEADLDARRETLASALDRLKLLVGRAPDAPLDVDPATPLDDPFSAASIATQPAETLVTLALASRIEIRETRDRVADARRHAEIARWNLLPPMDLHVGYARRGLGSPAGEAFNQLLGGWRVGVSTTYAMDRSPERAAAETAQVSVRAAEQAVIDVERQVAAEIHAAHRGYQRSAQAIAIQSKALDLAEKQRRLAELRYEHGLAGNFDVVDAESNLAQARAALIAAEVGRVLAGLSLKRAVGALDPEALR